MIHFSLYDAKMEVVRLLEDAHRLYPHVELNQIVMESVGQILLQLAAQTVHGQHQFDV